MGVGAAIAGAAIVGGAYSANQASNAAEDASDAQAQSGRESIAFQKESRDLARSDLAPFRGFATSRSGTEYDRRSPMGMYSSLLKPKNQAAYLTSNPMFQAAINQFGTKAKNTLGFSGLKGDLANAITQNYMASGNQYIDAQLNRLLNPIQIGQSAAAGQANTALAAGQSVGDTMIGIGNAQAAGTVGAANANTQAFNSLLSSGAQAYGAYAANRPPAPAAPPATA